MTSSSKFALRLLAPTAALALVCFACLGSLLFINDGNSPNQQKNHWQQLGADELSYGDIKKAVAVQNLPEALRPRARLLANLYRQQGKQAEAATIYRILWVAAGDKFNVTDGRELAAIYTDMGGSASAIESYQKIISYDRSTANQASVATDLNNLGQCYYITACTAADPQQRKQYLLASQEQYRAATEIIDSIRREKLATTKGAQLLLQADQKIIQLNSALTGTELDGSVTAALNMKQSSR